MGTESFSLGNFEVEITDNSEEIIGAFENAIGRFLVSAGKTGEKYAQDELTRQGAVDTGNLRQKTTYKPDNGEKAVYIGTAVEYGKYVEFGTGQYATTGGGTPKPSWTYQDDFGNWHMAHPMRARPFVKPAVANHAKEYRDMLQDSLENA